MSLAMLYRIKALEDRVAELEKSLTKAAPQAMAGAGSGTPTGTHQPAVAVSQRAMCPKCGEKPNHFFHVKNCQKNKNNGEKTDERRDQGST